MINLRIFLFCLFLSVLSACEGNKSPRGSSSGTPDIVKADNELPVVNAGSEETIVEKSTIVLSGSAVDSDGEIVAYLWSQVDDGPFAVELTRTASPSTTLIAPAVTEETQLTFRLTVTDNDGGSAVDDVVITVVPENTPPTVTTGANQDVYEFAEVTLTGSVEDEDGEIASYQWFQTEGTDVSFRDLGNVSATFIAPAVSQAETLVFELRATDNEGAQNSSIVKINVQKAPLRSVSGVIEKGPFGLLGSISFVPMDKPDAEPVSAPILDKLGGYTVYVPSAKFYKVEARGSYFSEVTGQLSDTEIALKAIHAVTPTAANAFNVNVLTHITYSRVLWLTGVDQLASEDAIIQAETELKQAFSTLLGAGPEAGFAQLSLFESDHTVGSPYLLALSALLESHLQNGSTLDLQKLLNTLQQDFSSDGLLDNSSDILAGLEVAMQSLDIESMNTALNSLIATREGYTLANVDVVIDSDLDGVRNMDDTDKDNDGIEDADDVHPYTPSFLVSNQQVVTDEDGGLAINVSSNNPLGEDILLVIDTDASNGSLSGSYPELTYIPEGDFYGVDSFSYHLEQGDIVSDSAMVTVEVIAQNDAPEISGDPDDWVLAGTVYEFTPSVNDIENDALTYQITNLPAWASFDQDTGLLSGSPSNDDAGEYNDILIEVSDGAESTQLPAFTISVEANPFSLAAVAPARLSGTKAVEVQGKMYVFGGLEALAEDPRRDDIVVHNDVYVFDPAADSWSVLGQLPEPATELEVHAVGDLIYIFGKQSSATYGLSVVDFSYSFDPVSETWTALSAQPVKRIDSTSAVVNEKIYLMSGRDTEATDPLDAVTDVHIYDTATDSWSIGAPIPLGTRFACAVALGEKIYVAGGDTFPSSNDTLQVYDTRTDTWQNDLDMPSIIERNLMACAEFNGDLYFFGGTPSYESSFVYRYDVEENNWVHTAYMPVDTRRNFSALFYDGKAYLFPGEQYDVWSNELWIFDPAFAD